MIHGQKTSAHHQAAHRAHFVVIGASLAGLSAAIALTRVGHRVTVLEACWGLHQLPSGGMRIPPNQSKVLAHWGIREAFQDQVRVVNAHSMETLLYSSHERLGRLRWDTDILREVDGDWSCARHADYRRFLYQCALANGAHVRFDARVASVDPAAGTVRLASGERVEADIIIGADGASGIARATLVGKEEPVAPVSVIVNLLVPVSLMKGDPELESVLEDDLFIRSWFGDNHGAIGYQVAGRTQYALHLCLPAASLPTNGGWATQAAGDKRAVLAALGECAPVLRRLVAVAPELACVAVRRHAQLEPEDWVHEGGRMLLIGDAAHPFVPCGIQGTSMALEDAAVLGSLFGRLRRASQAPSLLHAFVSVRGARVRALAASDWAMYEYFVLPQADPVARARNDILRAQDGVDPARHRRSARWAATLLEWNYDAGDEADSWWVEWGMLGERASMTEPLAPAFDFRTAMRIETSLTVA